MEPDDTVEVFTPPSTRTPPIEDLKKDEKKTEVEKQHPGDRSVVYLIASEGRDN